ncbi:polypeptide N-acetylgalactosaminyltransferase 9-like 2 [Homarus americanus]|uniref:Polypeptide N-acetylgalactosaminyltransferase 9-like 2 n=1 Tax=Homarus americanus TaxID=6706 RepID=A0A8J5KG38_HOMAM|nr:polypeptide N-acetylgalactosaminyltransferase 9-like 2 [Homarus americanus]
MPGWLEPLLVRIAVEPQTVVCPVIDVISDDSFEYHYRDSSGVNVGGFDWNLQVYSIPIWQQLTYSKRFISTLLSDFQVLDIYNEP